jgi:hypothetical protein
MCGGGSDCLGSWIDGDLMMLSSVAAAEDGGWPEDRRDHVQSLRSRLREAVRCGWEMTQTASATPVNLLVQLIIEYCDSDFTVLRCNYSCADCCTVLSCSL